MLSLLRYTAAYAILLAAVQASAIPSGPADSLLGSDPTTDPTFLFKLDENGSPVPPLPTIKQTRTIMSSSNPLTVVRDLLATRAGDDDFNTIVRVKCWTETNCSGRNNYQWGYTLDTSGNVCVKAKNCQCMEILTLKNAHISFWNSDHCDGNRSQQNGCFANGNLIRSSPGTNSLGFQKGCT
ncbi:hypothetical protein BKA61DRAFT_710147 [Leptodontidium sp. MPI-SDFR-AT-0119]|nr:hypothetical protein BKA61DRAFT_710147 [Leptodontidium sp. MPI-SDFR-AT-0119]